MPRFRVLLTDYAWQDLDIERSILQGADAELIVAPQGDEQTLIGLATDVDAIMTNWAQTPSSVIGASGNVRIVARLGIGLDNIDVEYCTRNNIMVTNVPDYCLIEVAEHALAQILSMGRKISFYHLRTKRSEYDLQAGAELRRLEEQVVGIIGWGNIGQCLAAKALGIGMKVVAYSRSQSNSMEGVRFCSLNELYELSDYVSLHVPLNHETKHLINSDALSQMKPTAYLINTARGGIVDQSALLAAIQAGHIAGAALDVQDPEPADLDDDLFRDERVVVSPHAAFVSRESLVDLRTRVSTQVSRALHGERPESVVNPSVLGNI